MASSNELIIEVVGSTKGLTKGLADAEKQLNRFAGRASSWDARAAANQAKRDKADADHAANLEKNAAAGRAEADAIEQRSQAMRRFAARAAVVTVGVNVLANNFGELGGEGERFDKAIGKLTSGNFVGFYKATRDNSQAVADLTKKLITEGDAAKSTAMANEAAARGFDEVEASARAATLAILAAQAAQAKAIVEPGEGRLGSIGGPSAVADVKGKPLTAEQRRRFFDARIARELDRAQDQVGPLRKIAAEIQKRIDATKDITRRLNLEDQLVDVNRRIERIQTDAASESARLAKERADAEKERLRNLKEAAAARQQARDDLALGLQTPGVPNLRKQLAQLTGRSDINSLPNKLGSALDGARRILNRKSKDINEDTRSNIQSLFDTIRQELNKGASGGPLTKTTQLSDRILAGLGLSAADSRILKARLSHFNSAGTALAGAGAGSINLTSTTVIDGKVVATTSGKYTRRARSVNPSQRNGPNPGRYD